jgi:peptidase C10-like protein
MKTLTHVLTVLALALLPNSNGGEAPENRYLLKTQWYQDGPFAQFTPNHERVGCWSTAYAQILYHHRLKPTGRVTYDCSSGQKVDIDLDAYRFDWNQFADEISAATPKKAAEQLAQYSFATAVVVQKDFGTDHYKRVLSSVADLETHFAVDAEIYVYLVENPPIPLEALKAKTRSENISNMVDKAQIVTLLTKELGLEGPSISISQTSGTLDIRR